MNIRILIRVRPLLNYHRYWKCIYTDASLSISAFGSQDILVNTCTTYDHRENDWILYGINGK